MISQNKAIVACGHPEVSMAAIATLKKGGNAFDATIAAGLVSPLAEPALTSLGGGGFLLSRTAAGQATLFDFFADTPGRGLNNQNREPHFFPVTVRFSGSDQDFNIGLGSVAVPGNLKGFLHIHKKLGKLPFSEIVGPAIELARRGVRISGQQAYFLDLLKPIMILTNAGKKLFAPNGRFLKDGDFLVNRDYADFLEDLPKDMEKNFYEGDLAQRIAADMEHGQGLLTAADLHSYQVIERKPLAANYRGRQLLTNPPPSFGGNLICAALRLLEKLPLSEYSWSSSEHLDALATVMVTIEGLRQNGFDPMSSDWVPNASKNLRTFSRGTTHISVMDSYGNVASMTTSNGEGSGYIVPGTGIMLNNMLGEDDLHPDGFHAGPPGQRVCSMMAPSILVRDNIPELILGSGGSKRIRTAITQVISNIIDFDMDVDQAVKAPRLHWDGKILQTEPDYPEATVGSLRKKWPVNIWGVQDVYFGGVHAIARGKGGGDPRRGGDVRYLEL